MDALGWGPVSALATLAGPPVADVVAPGEMLGAGAEQANGSHAKSVKLQRLKPPRETGRGAGRGIIAGYMPSVAVAISEPQQMIAS
jgi:hypothetical protein